MRKKLLLHSCCGPCSTSVIEKLKDDFDITIFYYNPNIYPHEEYLKRLSEQKRYIKESCQDIKVIDGTYDDNNKFEEFVKGFENCAEGGSRCKLCFEFRLDKVAKMAKEKMFDIFATTLSVSPHKNAKLINQIGLDLQNKYNIEYLIADFKKQDGYLKSIQLSKEYNLYRQQYCGCKFSLNK